MSDGEPKLAPRDEVEERIFSIVSALPSNTEMNKDRRSSMRKLLHAASLRDGIDQDHAIKVRWTKEVVTSLATLGRQLGFYADGANFGRRGWMYDIIWRKINDGDWGLVNRVPLVLACDWYVPGINAQYPREAMDKLVIARAEHRVLVCQSRAAASLFEAHAAYADQCDITERGDRYQFLCYQTEDRKFYSHVHIAKS